MNTIPTNGEVIAYVIFGIIALLALWVLMRGANTGLTLKLLGVSAEIGTADRESTSAKQDKIGG